MNEPATRSTNQVRRALFLTAGTICLGLGAFGIFLPILPTTPFLLLAAACYAQSSKRMHRWLLNNKWFGEYIRNYKEGKGISSKGKIFTLTLLWTTIGFSAFFLVDLDLLRVILLIVAVAVSAHVILLPTFRKKQPQPLT